MEMPIPDRITDVNEAVTHVRSSVTSKRCLYLRKVSYNTIFILVVNELKKW